MFVAVDFFAPIAQALSFFYSLVPNYAAAIALLTLAVMIVLTPLTLKGTRSMMIMQSLQPEMKKLQAQYKDDRQKLNEELLKFYKENNINPLGGCLPLLIQLPVFLILYRVIAGLTYIPAGQTTFHPKYLDQSSELYRSLVGQTQMRALGMNLAESATKALQHSFVSVLPYLILIIGVAATSIIQQRQISGRNPAAASNPQQQMLMRLGPIMITGFSLIVPGALVIYFFVSNLYRVGQQALISRTIYNTPEAKKLLETQAREAEAKKKNPQPQKGFFQRMLGDAAAPQLGKAKPTSNGSGGKTSPPKGGAGPGKPPAAKSNGGRTTPSGSRSAAARKKKRRK
jgi:YidC/Oxa1 family membrane protein insertase